MPWTYAVASNLILLFCAVLIFRAWLTRDWPKLLPPVIGGSFAAMLVYRPTLIPDLMNKLTDAFVGDVAPESKAPASKTPAPASNSDPITVPWATIGLVAGGVIMTVIALAVVTTAVGRHRERASAERRRADDHTRRRNELEQRHDAIRDAHGDFELNLLDNLDRLALADVTVPQTERLIDALDAARDARISTAREALDTYRQAVTALELAWKSADHFARSRGARYLPVGERRNIAKAQQALAIALDERGYAPQRQDALRRALKLIGDIIPIPKKAIASLEAGTRLALTKD